MEETNRKAENYTALRLGLIDTIQKYENTVQELIRMDEKNNTNLHKDMKDTLTTVIKDLKQL